MFICDLQKWKKKMSSNYFYKKYLKIQGYYLIMYVNCIVYRKNQNDNPKPKSKILRIKIRTTYFDIYDFLHTRYSEISLRGHIHILY